jgi:SAM-dependent methyltransferase
MPEWYEEAFDEFYLDIYSHRDDKEAEQFVAYLGKTLPLEGIALLDVCCGEGRHLRAFENGGARGFGLDLSEVLLERLTISHEGRELRVVRGDMRDFPFASESFDVCINMFTSLGYFQTRQEELRVISETWRVLKRGGLVVVDHVNPVWVADTLEPRSVKRKGDLVVEEKRRLLEEGKAVEKTISIRSIQNPEVLLREYSERVALFRRGELEHMLEQAGYVIDRSIGSYDGEPFRENRSCRLIVLARKP